MERAQDEWINGYGKTVRFLDVVKFALDTLEKATVYAARATLWIFLDRCGLTFKKRPRTRPSRTARTS